MAVWKEKIEPFLIGRRWALLVLALLLCQRLAALYTLGVYYSLGSDDIDYLQSGITFAKTGMLTMHEDYCPSAQIMPGMPVLIGLFSLLFGEGMGLWAALKLLWVLMGTLTAWFVYRSVCIFAPQWCGVAAMLCLFRADFVWMDNLLLTETPFLLALTAAAYYTFMMAKAPGWRYFWCCAAAYMFGLMFKANIAPYPLLALLYLLLMRYDHKLLLRQCGALAGVVLCFVIPWSVRNYMHFHAFVPLTYGVGNPTLLGTYQGVGYPADEGLDYETNVEAVAKEKYAAYYDEKGQVMPEYERFVNLGKDGIKARYRQQVWWGKGPQSMLASYLAIKPWSMVNSIFYWEDLLGQGRAVVSWLQHLNLALCLLTVPASVLLKKNRKQVLFLGSTYLANIYIYAMTFAFDRYNASLMGLRFILAGIGLGLLAQLAGRAVQALRAFHMGKL